MAVKLTQKHFDERDTLDGLLVYCKCNLHEDDYAGEPIFELRALSNDEPKYEYRGGDYVTFSNGRLGFHEGEDFEKHWEPS